MIGDKESAFSSYVVGWRYDKNPGRLGSFSAPGQAELLWWGVETNELIIWRMNGAQLVDAISWGPTSLGPRDLLRTAADFNGDGLSDLLWCDLESKEVKLWLLGPRDASQAGGNLPSGVARMLNLGKIEHDIFCVRAGDFNGDGKADLLWRNPNNGRLMIWHMDGADARSGKELSDPAWQDWLIKGLGDFNASQDLDLLWRNQQDGKLRIWLMERGDLHESAAPAGAEPLPDWRLKGLGNLDGDGRADLLWLDRQTGAVHIWLMDGLNVTSQASPGIAPDYK